MDELIFEVTQESDGGFVAECLTESIFTQADDWQTLRDNVKEAAAGFHFDQPGRPRRIRLHLVRDEVLDASTVTPAVSGAPACRPEGEC